MKKAVVLTGGSGFIGRYLCEKLTSEQPNTPLKNLDLVKPEFDFTGEYISGDIRDRGCCDKLCRDADVVINLAAAHKDFGIERDEYFDVNENGTRTILEAMDEAGVKRMIFTSSVAVYDPGASNIDENTVPDPQNHYGASKLAAEKVIEQWLEKGDGRQAFILRPTVVIGPRNRATMYSLIDQIVKGKYMFNLGSGQNVKSLAIVQNLVDLVCQKMETEQAEAMEIVNFVDAPQLTTRKIIEIIHDALGKKMPGITIPVGVASCMAWPLHLAARMVGKHSPITPARIKKLALQTKFESVNLPSIGYQPGMTTEAGIRAMVDWYVSQTK